MTALLPNRYRKWTIAEDVDLVVRCELDGVMNYKGQEQLLLIKALNEFDPKFSGKQPRCACKTEATIDPKLSPLDHPMSIKNDKKTAMTR